jgi:hypothetical protein
MSEPIFMTPPLRSTELGVSGLLGVSGVSGGSGIERPNDIVSVGSGAAV